MKETADKNRRLAGKYHPLTGKPKTLEHRMKMREAKLGSKNPNFGGHKEESKEKMRNSQKQRRAKEAIIKEGYSNE